MSGPSRGPGANVPAERYKATAPVLLRNTGYELLDARYTDAAGRHPRRTLKERALGRARHGVRRLCPDLDSRPMGAYSLLVLAR